MPTGICARTSRPSRLPEVTKIELCNNEFGLKYRMLRDEPETKFLLYKEGPQPADLDNWLLDVQLAHGEFRTDQAAIWLAELELGYEFADIVKDHAEFFNSRKRRETLKELVTQNDTPGHVRLKMLAVCAGSDPRLDSVLENLLDEQAQGKTERMGIVERSNLKSFLWEHVQKAYGYSSGSPGVHDFVIELFKSCYAMGTDGTIRLGSEALVFLKRWKDSRQHEEAFEKLSERMCRSSRHRERLDPSGLSGIIELDYFELIDRKVLSDLVSQVLNRTHYCRGMHPVYP